MKDTRISGEGMYNLCTADIDKDPDVVYSVMYEEKDQATFFLVYAIWCKQYRGLTDEKLYKAMLKESTKHVC